MLISCLTASVMVSIVRHLSEDLHSFQVVFFRNAAALLFLLPWLMRSGIKVIKTTRIKMYGLRASVGLIAMYFWFYSVSIVPLSLATALSFTAPLFTAVLAVFFFGEKYGIHRTAALIIGFTGAIIVIQPGTEGFNYNSIYALIAASLWAFSGIIIKSLTNTDAPVVVAFYMVLMMTPLSIPLAVMNWHEIKYEHIVWIIALGYISNIFQISLSKAIASTDFFVILPFDFTRLIFVSVIAYFAFDQVIDLWTAVGSAIIMASAVYTTWREARIRNTKKAEELIGYD